MSSLEDRARAASAELARQRAQEAAEIAAKYAAWQAEEAVRQAALDRDIERSKRQILEFIDLARRYNAPTHVLYRRVVTVNEVSTTLKDTPPFRVPSSIYYDELPPVWVLTVGHGGCAVDASGCLYIADYRRSIDGEDTTTSVKHRTKLLTYGEGDHPVPEEVILEAARNVVDGIDPFHDYD